MKTPPFKYLQISMAVAITLASSTVVADEPSTLSELIANMAPGTWAQANQNTFQSVWTPPEYRVNASYGDNMSGIIRAWSGTAWDSNRGDLILYGGGHANYPGNEVYIWHSSNLQWERASLPTNVKAVTTDSSTQWVTVDNGATPASSHTYDNNVYLPKLDRFLTFGGFAYGSGTPYLKVSDAGKFVSTGPYLFNPALADGNKVGGATGTGVNPATPGNNMWQNRDNAFGSFGEGIAAVTQEGGKDVVYSMRQYGSYGDSLYKYVINDLNDPAQDTWTLVGTPHPTTIKAKGAGAIDPINNIFVRTGVSEYNYWGSPVSFDFFYWDLNTPGSSNQEKSFNVVDNTGGLFDFNLIKDTGLQYDPIGKRFLLWSGGNNVYTVTHLADAPDLSQGWVLDIDNTSALEGPGGVLANNIPETGVLGKWDFAPDYGVMVGLKDSYNGNVWIYKPSNSAVPLPAAAWLFISGLGMIGFNSRRNKK